MSTIPTDMPDGQRPVSVPGAVPDRPAFVPFTSETRGQAGPPGDVMSRGGGPAAPQPFPSSTVPPLPGPRPSPPEPGASLRSLESAEQPRLIWPARILFALSLTFLSAYLFIAYVFVMVNDSYILLGVAFGSGVTIWIALAGLAVVGSVGVLLLANVAWWKKLLATALIFVTQFVFVFYDSYVMSSSLVSCTGIDVNPTIIEICMSVFTLSLPLVAWNLVRHRRLWSLAVAFGFGTVASLVVVSASHLLQGIYWGYPLSRIPWMLAPLVGLLLMHVVSGAGRNGRAAAMPSIRAFDARTDTAVQQGGGYAYPVGTASNSIPMTNTLAVLSLVFSFIVAIVGVILGHVALSQIARTGQEGRGLAITGLVVGYVSLLAGMIFSVRAIYLFSQLF